MVSLSNHAPLGVEKREADLPDPPFHVLRTRPSTGSGGAGNNFIGNYMNLVICLLMMLMVLPCAALTLEDLDDIVAQALAAAPTDAHDVTRAAYKPMGYDAMLARVKQNMSWYFNNFGISLEQLPVELKEEVQNQVVLLTKALVTKAKQGPVSNQAVQQAVATMLAGVFNPKDRYVVLPQLPAYVDKTISQIQKEAGLEEKDLTPGAERAIKMHKQLINNKVQHRLKKIKRSYTTDKEINQLADEQTQLLLKQLWLNTQRQAQQLTMAYLAEHHKKSSFYAQPPEAKRLQCIANALKKQIKSF